MPPTVREDQLDRKRRAYKWQVVISLTNSNTHTYLSFLYCYRKAEEERIKSRERRIRFDSLRFYTLYIR